MKFLFAAFLLFTSSQVYADCSQPETPSIPNGLEADLDTMVQGQQAVKAYISESEIYLDCLNAAADAAAETDTDEQRVARNEEHDAWVDAMENVANSFNQELRNYRENNQ